MENYNKLTRYQYGLRKLLRAEQAMEGSAHAMTLERAFIAGILQEKPSLINTLPVLTMYPACGRSILEVYQESPLPDRHVCSNTIKRFEP